MKAASLLLAALIMGCMQSPADIIVEVRLGIYVTNSISALPLPPPGYDMYVIGEDHGAREPHLLTIDYLKRLNETLGLRDIVLEEPQAYERVANEYVLGISDSVPCATDAYAQYLVNLLTDVRAFNETLSEDKKIRAHLVDIDSPFSAIHFHLQDLARQIEAPNRMEVPPLEVLKNWSKHDIINLIDKLAQGLGDSLLQRELETLMTSLDFYFSGNQIGIDVDYAIMSSEGCRIREERIVHVLENLLMEANGPLLVKCGGWHAQKHQAMSTFSDIEPWTQQLIESGVNVYSMYVIGITGRVWYSIRGAVQYNRDPYRMKFADGTSLGNILDAHSDYDIFCVDLRMEVNGSARLDYNFEDILAGVIYDCIIVFRKFTPLLQE